MYIRVADIPQSLRSVKYAVCEQTKKIYQCWSVVFANTQESKAKHTDSQIWSGYGENSENTVNILGGQQSDLRTLRLCTNIWAKIRRS